RRLPVIAPGSSRPPRITQPPCGRDSDVVTEYLAADLTPRELPHRRHEHHSTRAARRGQLVPADAHLVPNGDGATEAQGGGGDRGRSTDESKKQLSWSRGEVVTNFRLWGRLGLVVSTWSNA